jgi:hypothetical protein
MKNNGLRVLTLALLAMRVEGSAVMSQTRIAPLHVSNSFELMVPLPLKQAAPLFGPEAERCWAGEHWNLAFLHPQPGMDVQGAVFTVQHGVHKSVWVNVVFDLGHGRMQYVAFIPEAVVTTVDVRLTAMGEKKTKAEVTYVRTALDARLNSEVEAMGKRDRESGPEWQQGIEDFKARQGR